jgi:thiamine-phosphate pyrophosphorylase
MIPPLHVVTDDAVLARREFLEQAAGVLEAGGGRLAFHLRGRGTSGRILLEQADALMPVVRAHGAILLVNDRVDVALCAGTDGVHVGTGGLPVAVCRGLLPAGSRVGVSVHGVAEVASLLQGGAMPDLLLAGTLYATPSHPGRPGAGPLRIREVAGAAGGVPVVGIGGITPARVAEVMEAGAVGVAVIRAVWDAADPAMAVRSLLESLV